MDGSEEEEAAVRKDDPDHQIDQIDHKPDPEIHVMVQLLNTDIAKVLTLPVGGWVCWGSGHWSAILNISLYIFI